MPKIKITSANRTQQNNVIAKCRAFGAVARDGNYGPVSGKTAVVVNTQLGNGAALQLSDVNFTPTKKPYSKVISYKDFMNATVCPWDKSATIPEMPDRPITDVPTAEVHVAVVAVPVETGVCSQDTLVPTSCTVLTQEAIAWKTVGLPFLEAAGVSVTMDGGVAYIINTRKNTAKALTAKSAAKKAKKDLLAGNDSPWVSYAQEFDLFTDVVLTKQIDGEDA